MDWITSYVQWRNQQGAIAFLLELVFLVPCILLFHYTMYHTKMSYKAIKSLVEWLPIVVVTSCLIGITFYYA
jgi:hypothetical protein